MNNITLYEHVAQKCDKLSESELREIERINDLHWREILEIWRNKFLKAKQFVWTLRVWSRNIQILPKILWDIENTNSNSEKQNPKKQRIIKNLMYMLSYTKKLSIKESDIAQLWEIDDLFEVFIYLYAKDLLQLLKKDFKKTYNSITENSSFLKWKLLFSRHILKNQFNAAKFFVHYETMDENTLLNIFLSSVCHKLFSITKSQTSKKLLQKCLFIMKDIKTYHFASLNELKNISITRHNKNYENVFGLWKMLYFWNSPDFSNQKIENFSILFDMNVLFEEFIYEFLKRNKHTIHESIDTVNSQVAKKYVFRDNKFSLRPDVVIDFKNRERCIIDTKYKKLWWTSYNWVSSWDIYQMLTYWLRYFEDQDTREKNMVLLYPDYDTKDYSTCYESNEWIRIHIWTISLSMNLWTEKWKQQLVYTLWEIVRNTNTINN